MVRFLHTGDWQLGMNYRHTGEKGAILRQARLDALAKIVQIADEQSVDFIVATGDQFEHNQVEPALVQQVVTVLAKSKVPIYLIPGNHDPWKRQSVYKQNVWSQASQVHILTERVPVSVLQKVELYPCPVYENHGSDDPTSWIPKRGTDQSSIRVGIAHGSLLIRDDMDFTDSYPIPIRAASEHELDYLAIGHWHSTQVYTEDKRTAYSGTHETTKFGEIDSGNVLLVEIDGPEAKPDITPIRTGTFHWKQIKRTVRTEADYTSLEHELTSLANPETTLVDVSLDGYVQTSLYPRFAADIRVLTTTRFLYGRFTNEIKISPSREDINNMLLSGVTKTVMEKLLLTENSDISNHALLILCEHLTRKGVIA